MPKTSLPKSKSRQGSAAEDGGLSKSSVLSVSESTVWPGKQAGSQAGMSPVWRTVCQLGCRLKESLNPSTSLLLPPRMSSVCAQLVIAAGQTCHWGCTESTHLCRLFFFLCFFSLLLLSPPLTTITFTWTCGHITHTQRSTRSWTEQLM